jgi:hypothetical protein
MKIIRTTRYRQDLKRMGVTASEVQALEQSVAGIVSRAISSRGWAASARSGSASAGGESAAAGGRSTF